MYFDAGLDHMATQPRDKGTNFDWLRFSCDLSPERNPEKYRMPVKSAIVYGGSVLVFVLVCITLCPIEFCNHLDKEERAGCFALIVFLMSCYC